MKGGKRRRAFAPASHGQAHIKPGRDMVHYPGPWMIAGQAFGYNEGNGRSVTPGLANLIHHHSGDYPVFVVAMPMSMLPGPIVHDDLQSHLEQGAGVEMLKKASICKVSQGETAYVPPGSFLHVLKLEAPSTVSSVMQQPVWSVKHAKDMDAAVLAKLKEVASRYINEQKEKSAAWRALHAEFESFFEAVDKA